MRMPLLAVLLIASSFAQATDLPKGVDSFRDTENGATCWTLRTGFGSSITCLPDHLLRGQQAGDQRHDADALAGEPAQEGPTPARSPAPRQHREAFQL